MIKSLKSIEGKKLWSWALYDWANSAYATTVLAGFFPLFFKQYWSSDLEPTLSTYYLGIASAASSLLLAILAPIMGSIADQGAHVKRFLFVFIFMGATATGLFYFVPQGDWLNALILYAISGFGFAASLVFYDALLLEVSPPEKFDFASSLGYSLGYLGGGLLFVINVLMYLSPQTFGLSGPADGILWSFVSVAIWWILFSIPLFVFVKERPRKTLAAEKLGSLLAGWKTFIETFKKIRLHREVFLFLLAYLFYIDGVNTIIRMAVDFGMAIGLEPADLIKALLLVQFIGFPSAIAFGYLGEKFGPKTGIYLALFVYAGVSFLALNMNSSLEFYLMAAVIGLVQGGIQSLSRSFFARIVPQEQSAEFFGFYNVLGKFSAILGPLIVGWVSYTMNNPRLGILSVLISFAIGGALLTLVKPPKKLGKT